MSSDARAVLEREMYWLTDLGGGAHLGPTERLLIALERLERWLAHDANQRLPLGDQSLQTGSWWRRRVKGWLHRLVRPVSRRYDRITADLAGTGAGLARRLIEAEAEVRRLDDEVAALGHALRTLSRSRAAGLRE
jgi:hypothetical protein